MHQEISSDLKFLVIVANSRGKKCRRKERDLSVLSAGD